MIRPDQLVLSVHIEVVLAAVAAFAMFPGLMRINIHRLAPGAGFAVLIRLAPDQLTQRPERVPRSHSIYLDQRFLLRIQAHVTIRKIKKTICAMTITLHLTLAQCLNRRQIRRNF